MDEKLYNKQTFSLSNGKTHKSVISKHEHVHAKLYLKISSVACLRLLLGAKSMPFGCMSMARLGAKYAVVGCKVYGYFWMHVCGFWVHVYGSVGCMYAVVG